MRSRDPAKLVALRCPSDNVFLSRTSERFARCDSCGVHYEIAHGGVKGVNVLTATDDSRPAAGLFPWSKKDYRLAPFWVFETQVSITNRSATGNIVSFFAKAFKGKDSGRVTVYVPAFKVAPEEFFNIGSHYTTERPNYRMVKGGKPEGVFLTSESAAKLVLPIVVGIEAKRPDTLHSISLSAKVLEERLEWLWV